MLHHAAPALERWGLLFYYAFPEPFVFRFKRVLERWLVGLVLGIDLVMRGHIRRLLVDQWWSLV
jgi:hypothetical protein